MKKSGFQLEVEPWQNEAIEIVDDPLFVGMSEGRNHRIARPHDEENGGSPKQKT